MPFTALPAEIRQKILMHQMELIYDKLDGNLPRNTWKAKTTRMALVSKTFKADVAAAIVMRRLQVRSLFQELAAEKSLKNKRLNELKGIFNNPKNVDHADASKVEFMTLLKQRIRVSRSLCKLTIHLEGLTDAQNVLRCDGLQSVPVNP